jgi:hypothetical protein
MARQGGLVEVGADSETGSETVQKEGDDVFRGISPFAPLPPLTFAVPSKIGGSVAG